MLSFQSLRPRLQPFILLFVILFPSFCSAADTSPALIVGESGAYLYGRQGDESKIIARLERGEELMPLAQAVGTESWYMVKTPKGAIGWVRSSDVRASDQLEKAIKESAANGASTWSAMTSTGRSFAGTWTVGANPLRGVASGTWSLQDAAGNTVMAGTWSASKSSKRWNGAWRAHVADRSSEYSGTWSADLRLAPNARFADLFEAAIQEAIGGGWKAGAYSGRWSIRATK